MYFQGCSKQSKQGQPYSSIFFFFLIFEGSHIGELILDSREQRSYRMWIFFFLTEILKLLHSVSYQLYLNKTEEKQTKIKRGFLQLRVVDYFGQLTIILLHIVANTGHYWVQLSMGIFRVGCKEPTFWLYSDEQKFIKLHGLGRRK